MSRYIDADAIVEEMDRYIEHFTRLGMVVDGNECFYKIRELLTDAPAADVVEVVRCKDCVHSHTYADAEWALCNIFLVIISIYGYCSSGERRE